MSTGLNRSCRIGRWDGSTVWHPAIIPRILSCGLASNFASDGYGVSVVPEPSGLLLASLALVFMASIVLFGRNVSQECPR